MNRNLLTATKELLVRHEGLHLRPRPISGNDLIIGFGRNLTTSGISLSEANILLINDICSCEKQLLSHIPDIYNSLNDTRKSVLINICFSRGINDLLAQAQTLAFIKSADFERAANCMLASRWAKQTGRRAIELSELMRHGKSPIIEFSNNSYKRS